MCSRSTVLCKCLFTACALHTCQILVTFTYHSCMSWCGYTCTGIHCTCSMCAMIFLRGTLTRSVLSTLEFWWLLPTNKWSLASTTPTNRQRYCWYVCLHVYMNGSYNTLSETTLLDLWVYEYRLAHCLKQFIYMSHNTFVSMIFSNCSPRLHQIMRTCAHTHTHTHTACPYLTRSLARFFISLSSLSRSYSVSPTCTFLHVMCIFTALQL